VHDRCGDEPRGNESSAEVKRRSRGSWRSTRVMEASEYLRSATAPRCAPVVPSVTFEEPGLQGKERRIDVGQPTPRDYTRITARWAEFDMDIGSPRGQTLGSEAVDAFLRTRQVRGQGHEQVVSPRSERAIMHATSKDYRGRHMTGFVAFAAVSGRSAVKSGIRCVLPK